jgi:hypothetical protein
MYKYHRWLAVISGGFFIVWVLTGILMMVPLPPQNSGTSKKVTFDFRMATLAPSDAIAALEENLGKAVEVKEVRLYQVLGNLVYQILIKNARSYLIDAQTGKEIIIDKLMAENIAKSYLPGHMKILKTEYFETHTSEYPYGSLPAYKISFNDTWKTISIVEAYGGKERHKNILLKIKQTIEGFHFFTPIEQVTGSPWLRKGILILVGILGMGAACTGYYLAYNRRSL